MKSDLYFRQIAVGEMANLAYLIGSHETREAVVVDPAWNVESLLDVVKDFTPEKAEAITTVPAEAIRTAARTYARAASSSIIYSMGITQHTTGTDNVLSYCCMNWPMAILNMYNPAVVQPSNVEFVNQ